MSEYFFLVSFRSFVSQPCSLTRKNDVQWSSFPDTTFLGKRSLVRGYEFKYERFFRFGVHLGIPLGYNV